MQLSRNSQKSVDDEKTNFGEGGALKSSNSLLISNLKNYNALKSDITSSNVLCILENLLERYTLPLLNALHTSRRNDAVLSADYFQDRTKLIHYIATLAENAADEIVNSRNIITSSKLDPYPLLLMCYDIMDKLHELYPCKIYIATKEHWTIENVEHALIYIACATDILQKRLKKSLLGYSATLKEETGRIQRTMKTLVSALCELEKCTYGKQSTIVFRNTQVAVYRAKIASAATPQTARFAVAKHLVFRAGVLMQMITKIKNSPLHNGTNRHYVEIAFEANSLLMDSIKKFCSYDSGKSYSLSSPSTQHIPGNVLLTRHNLFEGFCFADHLLFQLEKNAVTFAKSPSGDLLKEDIKKDASEIYMLFKNSLPICYKNTLHRKRRTSFSLKNHQNPKTTRRVTTLMRRVLNIVSSPQLRTLLDPTNEAHQTIQGIITSAERIISRFDSKNQPKKRIPHTPCINLTTYPGEIMEIKENNANKREVLQTCKTLFVQFVENLSTAPPKDTSLMASITSYMRRNSNTQQVKRGFTDTPLRLGEQDRETQGRNCKKSASLGERDNIFPSSTIACPRVEQQPVIFAGARNSLISKMLS